MNNSLLLLLNQINLSVLQEKKNKPQTKNEHVGWEGRFTAGVFYGYGDVNASRISDKQHTVFFTISGKREATAIQDRSSSQSGGRAPANLNKEGRRVGGEEGNEGRGKTWLGSSPAQTLPSMMWNGKGGFYFTHKYIIFTIKLFTVFGIAAKSFTDAAAEACKECTLILVMLYFWYFCINV